MNETYLHCITMKFCLLKVFHLFNFELCLSCIVIVSIYTRGLIFNFRNSTYVESFRVAAFIVVSFDVQTLY